MIKCHALLSKPWVQPIGYLYRCYINTFSEMITKKALSFTLHSGWFWLALSCSQRKSVTGKDGKREETEGTSKYALCQDAQQSLRSAWPSTLRSTIRMSQRQRGCYNAQVVGQSKTPKAPATGMKTIESLFRVEKQHQPPKAATLPVVASSTRSHPRFPNSHPEIQNFIKCLEGLDGERKSQNKAKAP